MEANLTLVQYIILWFRALSSRRFTKALTHLYEILRNSCEFLTPDFSNQSSHGNAATANVCFIGRTCTALPWQGASAMWKTRRVADTHGSMRARLSAPVIMVFRSKRSICAVDVEQRL